VTFFIHDVGAPDGNALTPSLDIGVSDSKANRLSCALPVSDLCAAMRSKVVDVDERYNITKQNTDT